MPDLSDPAVQHGLHQTTRLYLKQESIARTESGRLTHFRPSAPHIDLTCPLCYNRRQRRGRHGPTVIRTILDYLNKKMTAQVVETPTVIVTKQNVDQYLK
jgi:hypothetical protein